MSHKRGGRGHSKAPSRKRHSSGDSERLVFLDEEPLVSLFFYGSTSHTKKKKIVPCCMAKLMVIIDTNCAQSKIARLSVRGAFIKIIIREYGSTHYVGLARAVSPTNTNFRLIFLLNRLQEALYEDVAVYSIKFEVYYHFSGL